MSPTVWTERCRTPEVSWNMVEWRKRRNVSFVFRPRWLRTTAFIVLTKLSLSLIILHFLLFLGWQKGLSHHEKIYKKAPSFRVLWHFPLFGFLRFNLVLFICMFIIFENVFGMAVAQHWCTNTLICFIFSVFILFLLCFSAVCFLVYIKCLYFV